MTVLDRVATFAWNTREHLEAWRGETSAALSQVMRVIGSGNSSSQPLLT